MISKVKKSFRLIPYGYALKMNLIGGVLVFLLGLAGLCTGSLQAILSASIFMVLGPLVLLQVAGSLLYSGVIAASPRRRVVEIVLGDVLSVIASVIGYATVAGYIYLNQEVIERPAGNMILASICMAICVIYFGVAFKLYAVGSILFFIFVLGGYGLGLLLLEWMEFKISLASASVIGFLIMVFGVVLSSMFRRLLYKRSLSARACGEGLRKAMQS